MFSFFRKHKRREAQPEEPVAMSEPAPVQQKEYYDTPEPARAQQNDYSFLRFLTTLQKPRLKSREPKKDPMKAPAKEPDEEKEDPPKHTTEIYQNFEFGENEVDAQVNDEKIYQNAWNRILALTLPEKK